MTAAEDYECRATDKDRSSMTGRTITRECCQHRGHEGPHRSSLGFQWPNPAEDDPEEEDCSCQVQGGIVQDRDPLCPTHGAEDVISGAYTASERVRRAVHADLAQRIDR